VNELFIKAPDKEHISLMLYTSGTTGNPKGVMLTYDNLMVNIEGLRKYNMYGTGDRILTLLPMHHILPLMGSGIIPLYEGSTTIFLKELSSQAMTDALKKYKVTFMIGVPRLWEMLHKKIMEKINGSKVASALFKMCEKANNKNLSRKIFKKVHETLGGNIRFFVSGGSKLNPQVSKDFLTLGIDICEGYGMTETAPMISFTPVNEVVPGSAGKVIPGVEVKIAEDGEILAKGRNVMKGYYKKPEATAEIIDAEGWLHTGDLGELKEEYLYVTGRKKEMIVLSNGKNINPVDIEQWIMDRTNLIQEVAITDYQGRLTAVIYPNFQKVMEDGISNLLETFKYQIIDKYNAEAPNYRKILDIKIVKEELPKTKLGKFRRFMINDLLEEKVEQNIEIEEPDFEEYQAIKENISKLKGVPVTPNAHLELDLGLDSLDIVELLAFIESNYGIKVDESSLAENATVEKLATFVKNSGAKTASKKVNWSEYLSKDSGDKLPKSAIASKFLKGLFKLPLTFYIKSKGTGIENIPKDRPVLFVGNHQSFLDAFLFNNVLPNSILEKTYYMAKVEHFKSPAMKSLANNGNIILLDINKNLGETLQTAATVLKKGGNMVIFPEGTRSKNGKVGNFKKSFAILAKETGVVVVPFGIKGAFEAYPPNAKYPKAGNTEIKFFPAFETKNLSYDEIVKKAQSTIKEWVEK
jgi:long-chain acyl-CoA synthetase